MYFYVQSYSQSCDLRTKSLENCKLKTTFQNIKFVGSIIGVTITYINESYRERIHNYYLR